MSFHDVRLPIRLAFGSTGGVERRTEIVTLASGFERRSTAWAHGRRRYLIGAGVRALSDARALIAFFEARRGRLHGFRFKDFADFSAMDEPIGEGDGAQTEFQLIKAYGDYARLIAKPVAETVRVYLAGVETLAFTLDEAAGLVTFHTPPADGTAITATFEFDVPVRFDSDRIEVTLEGFDAGRLIAVPLVEIRV